MNELNKEDIEYIEQAEGIIWRLANVVKANIDTLEKIDKQVEHQLPLLRINIEDAILMQLRMYQKINELFPRLEEIEEIYVRNRSNSWSGSNKNIKLYAPRIWNIINIVRKLKPASHKDSWHKIIDENLSTSIRASYTRKPNKEDQEACNKLDELMSDQAYEHPSIHDNFLKAKYTAPIVQMNNKSYQMERNDKLPFRRNKKYTDYLRKVGISGQIGQMAILEPIVTSSNLVLKRD